MAKLARLRIETWSYKANPSVRHIGPMAQDFAALFGVGDDPRHILLSDATGVAYAAIQGLYRMLQANDTRLMTLRRDVQELQRALRHLRARKRAPGS